MAVWRKPWAAALLLAAATVLVFSTTLPNGLVYDDTEFLLANPAVSDPGFPW